MRRNTFVRALGLGSRTTVYLTVFVLSFTTVTSLLMMENVFTIFSAGHQAWSDEKRLYRAGDVDLSLKQTGRRFLSRLQGTTRKKQFPEEANHLVSRQELEQFVKEEGSALAKCAVGGKIIPEPGSRA